jgi:hypothetical protein
MHIFEFICADSNDEAAQKARNDSINAIKYIEEEYGDNKRVPAGKICWDGDQLGKAQDERKITAKDIVIAKWFAEIYPKSELKALEKRLTKKHCRKPETAYETKMKEKEKEDDNEKKKKGNYDAKKDKDKEKDEDEKRKEKKKEGTECRFNQSRAMFFCSDSVHLIPVTPLLLVIISIFVKWLSGLVY